MNNITKSIVVNEFNNSEIVDIYMKEGNKIIEFKQGLTLDDAENYLFRWIVEYSLDDNSIIYNTHFNSDESIKQYSIIKVGNIATI